MPKAERGEGDPQLRGLFEQFNGQLVSPGGAANLLGVSRKTIHTLGERGKLRIFHGPEKGQIVKSGPRWSYIPLADVAVYAEQVGRPFPRGHWASPES
jgi:hypothetical protein